MPASSRFTAGTPLDRARLGLGLGWYLGAWPMRLSRACRANDRPRVHALERRWARQVSKFLDVRLEVQGMDQVDPSRRTVVVALHEGFTDALALFHLGLDLRFVARDELREWRTLGRYLEESGQILLDTAAPRTSYRRMVRQGGVALDAGESVVVFPQGSILGIETAFMPGAFRMAQRLNAWVLPVVVTGSHLVWEYPYSPLVRFGQRITMRILPAMSPDAAVAGAREIESSMKRVALQPDMAPARRFRPEIDGYWDGYRYEIDPTFPEVAEQVAAHRSTVAPA